MLGAPRPLWSLLLLVLLALTGPTASRAEAPGEPTLRLAVERWRLLEHAWHPLDGAALDRGEADDALLEPLPVASGLRDVRVTHRFIDTPPPGGTPVDPSGRLLDLTVLGSARALSGVVSQDLRLVGYGVPGPAQPAGDLGMFPRLLRLGTKANLRGVESGLRVESVTSGIEKVTGPGTKGDQEGVEAWLAVRTGGLRFKAFVEDSRDNVADDPGRPWTRTTEAGVAGELGLPAGSLLSLGATRGELALTPAARGPGREARGQPTEFDILAGTLHTSGDPRWDATASSSYRWNADTGRLGAEFVSVSHDLSGSYRPISAVTIRPVLSLADAEDRTPSLGSQSLTGALTVVLAPLVDAFDLALYGGTTRSRTSDGTFDGRGVDTTAGLTLHLRRSPPTTTVTFEVGYHQYADAASQLGGYGEAVGLVVLKIASF